MTAIRALIVRHGEVLDTEIGTDLDSLQTAVGGWIEGVSPVEGDWHAYCDEEGKLKGLPINHRATRLAHYLGWPEGDVLCGPVVFVGEYDDEGEITDVPRHVIEAAMTMFGAGNVRRADTSSSASRQHFIDTGEYLPEGQSLT